jgi:hypothetical protein
MSFTTRRLPEAVGVGNDDYLFGYPEHFPDDYSRIRHVMKNCKLTNGFKAGVGERKGVTFSLDQGAAFGDVTHDGLI